MFQEPRENKLVKETKEGHSEKQNEDPDKKRAKERK
jgi:hypothetical protein